MGAGDEKKKNHKRIPKQNSQRDFKTEFAKKFSHNKNTTEI